MRDDLLFYYERELTFIRQMGAEFAEKYPKIASRLVLDVQGCGAPRVHQQDCTTRRKHSVRCL